MESIGSELRQARQAKDISIEQAQKDTRIHSKILKALEEDRLNQAASSPVYIKSFIKKYGDYLGLDGASLADEYIKKHPKPTEQVFTLRGKAVPFKFPLKRLASIAAAILIIFFGFRLLALVGSKLKDNFKSRPKVTKKVDVGRTKKTPKTIPSVAKVPIATQIKKGEGLLLTIKARKDVWLKVISDGTVIYEDILKKGSQENWQAKKSLKISTGRAEALNAELNGARLGPLGKGVVKGILITKDGLKLPR